MQECIDSVAAQNWPNIEHFVIDGGSTDETLSILERNAHLLTGVISEPDKGAAEAINKGFALCSGDIVAWLNADDFYLPDAFEKVAEAWRRNPDASYWFGNGVRVNEDGTVKGVFNPGPILFNLQALIEGLDYILQPSTFINSKLLVEAGLLRTDLRWSFDWDLWIRLAKLAQPATMDVELSASREWHATLTSGGGLQRAEELRRLAEVHSEKPLTPGALSYFIGAIKEIISHYPMSFSLEVVEAVQALKSKSQFDLGRLGVNGAGFPTINGGAEAPLKIAIDLYPLLAGVSGGIVPWVQGVFREMIRLYPVDQVLFFHRPGLPPLTIEGENVQFIPLHDHPGLFYEEMTRHCANANVDVVIRTYPQELHPHVPFNKQIFIIPDIQHEYFPDFFSKHALNARRRAFAYALSSGGAVATMTEHSRKTLMENPWTLCKDVFLMPAALPEELQCDARKDVLPDQLREFDLFFYMPANLWPHKNHRRLFEAFRLALPSLPARTGLVLTGDPDGFERLSEGFEDLPLVHLGFVPHEQVAALFSEAVALVYFSLFEGFGMPLLEAFHHGTPVLCSNTTALPEVGGDAVLACSPTDINAMAELMQRIVEEKDLREILIERGRIRLGAYDWASPAKSLRAALERTVERSRISNKRTITPLISIVMPTRNHARFIRESIDSVLTQNYSCVEFIVIDGASNDGTVDILQSYGDRIRWISEPDKGQTDAINKGMALVKGDILAYLNSDDILLPGALQRVAGFFQDHPECDLVYGNADYIDLDGKVTGAYATAEYSFERLMQDNCICQPAAFWRKRIFDRVGFFNAELQTAMDYEYWLRIANAGGVIYHSKETLAQSRLHEDAKTLSMRGVIFQEILKICKEQGGLVSLSYLQGWWSYRLYETRRWGSTVRRFLPGVHRVPAFVHYIYQYRQVHGSNEALSLLGRRLLAKLDRKVPVLGNVARRSWRQFAFIRKAFNR